MRLRDEQDRRRIRAAVVAIYEDKARNRAHKSKPHEPQLRPEDWFTAKRRQVEQRDFSHWRS